MRRMYSKGQLEELIKEALESNTITIDAHTTRQIELKPLQTAVITGMTDASVEISSTIKGSTIIFSEHFDESGLDGLTVGNPNYPAYIRILTQDYDNLIVQCTLEGNLILSTEYEY